jgi:serine/threonine protein kinase
VSLALIRQTFLTGQQVCNLNISPLFCLTGVIIYTILGGYSPFDEPDSMELIRKIRSGDFEFHAQYWDPVSKDAKKLIKKLLRVNPEKRYTAKKALKSKWIKTDADALASHDLANNLNHFRLFCAKRKFKIAINAIIAANKLKELSVSLHAPPPLVFASGKFQTSYKIGKEVSAYLRN